MNEMRSKFHQMDTIRMAIMRMQNIMKARDTMPAMSHLRLKFWYNPADPGACDALEWWQTRYIYRLLNIMSNDELMKLVNHDFTSGYTLMRLADYAKHPRFDEELRRGYTSGFSTIIRRLAHVKTQATH